jgi:cytochrome c
MGAPAIGDKKAWAAVNKKGMDAVYKNGINGINGMPAKGGSNLSEAEFKSVVDYIVSLSK